MSQYNIGSKTFTAWKELEAYRRVRLVANNGSTVEYADAVDPSCIGVTAAKVRQGEPVAIELKTTGRTFKMTANGVIPAGGNITLAQDGKVAAPAQGSTLPVIGKALEAAASDGEIIEIIFT